MLLNGADWAVIAAFFVLLALIPTLASLKSEAESLKGKLEEERAKLHDVECECGPRRGLRAGRRAVGRRPAGRVRGRGRRMEESGPRRRPG